MRPRMAWDHLFSFIQVSLIYEEGSDSMNRLIFIERCKQAGRIFHPHLALATQQQSQDIKKLSIPLNKSLWKVIHCLPSFISFHFICSLAIYCIVCSA